MDYFKTAINGSPLELADFGLAGAAGDVADLAGDLTPTEDFWMAGGALLLCVLLLFLTGRLTALGGTGLWGAGWEWTSTPGWTRRRITASTA